MVVELFKFIHPHFSGSDAVGQSLAAGVGSLLGENVANVRAGVCLQGPTALPDLCTEQGGGRWVSGGRAAGPHCPQPGGRAHRRHDEHRQGLALQGMGGHLPSTRRTQNAVKEQEHSLEDEDAIGSETLSPCTEAHALDPQERPQLTSPGTHLLIV